MTEPQTPEPAEGLCDLCRTWVEDRLTHQRECPEAIAYALRPREDVYREYWLVEERPDPEIVRVLGVPTARDTGDRPAWYYRALAGNIVGPLVKVLKHVGRHWRLVEVGALNERAFSSGPFNSEATARRVVIDRIDELTRRLVASRRRIAGDPVTVRPYRRQDEAAVILKELS